MHLKRVRKSEEFLKSGAEPQWTAVRNRAPEIHPALAARLTVPVC
jgi:hypothetical protein